MLIYFKIAFRNILKNKKRTLLIGLTLVISCTLLLFSFSIGNGIRRQIMDKYRDSQSGDVAVVWKNVKEIDSNDPSRMFFSQYDVKLDKENREAIRRLDEFVSLNAGEIRESFKSVRGNGMLDTGRFAAFSLILGVSEEELSYLQDKKVFQLLEGEMPFESKYGICISDEAAAKYNIGIGDWVILDSSTASGYVNTMEYCITGLYKSSSDFDSIYVYMTREDALELLDQGPEYFQSVRIYLNNPGQADRFAAELDSWLMQSSNVLRAESITFSAEFYSMIGGFLKNLFTLFMSFLLFIVAIGIRSVVRMNLFERMKEFGTLRAIGFNRFQGFVIIFLEVFLLSLIFFGMAFAVTLILVYASAETGIHIGKGAVAYVLGGEYIYPVFVLSDTLTAMAIITVFSVFAPLKPGLRLCWQKITDLLAQNQKPVYAVPAIAGSMFRKPKKTSKAYKRT
jgi:putative ABC transport system permease protein